MQIEYGKVKEVSIGENQESGRKVVLITVEASEPDDVTDQIELHGFSGDDIRPVVGSRIFFSDVSDSMQMSISIDDGIEPDESIEKGEREIYSHEDGTRKAKTRWKKNGEVVINDGTDYGVYYEKLEKAFNDLKAEHDNLVSKHNEHIHVTTATVGPTPTTGIIAPTTSKEVPSKANIAPAKVEKVRI